MRQRADANTPRRHADANRQRLTGRQTEHGRRGRSHRGRGRRGWSRRRWRSRGCWHSRSRCCRRSGSGGGWGSRLRLNAQGGDRQKRGNRQQTDFAHHTISTRKDGSLIMTPQREHRHIGAAPACLRRSINVSPEGLNRWPQPMT